MSIAPERMVRWRTVKSLRNHLGEKNLPTTKMIACHIMFWCMATKSGLCREQQCIDDDDDDPVEAQFDDRLEKRVRRGALNQQGQYFLLNAMMITRKIIKF